MLTGTKLVWPGASARRHVAPAGLHEEEARFDRFCAAAAPPPTMALWRQSRSLVTTIAFVRNPRYAEAATESAELGWPVHVRRSGGTTVFHGDGTCCVSVLREVAEAGFSIAQAFLDFAGLLVAACAEIGLAATIGPAPHAPCDGEFNILVDGRKLAGTAMRVRQVGAGRRLLAHAVFFVEDPLPGLAAVERFERALGLDVAYPAAGSVGLAEALPGQQGEVALAAALATAFRRGGRWVPLSLSR